MASDGMVLPAGYGRVLLELKERVRSAQMEAHRQLNTALVQLYWSIARSWSSRNRRDGEVASSSDWQTICGLSFLG